MVFIYIEFKCSSNLNKFSDSIAWQSEFFSEPEVGFHDRRENSNNNSKQKHKNIWTLLITKLLIFIIFQYKNLLFDCNSLFEN